MDFLNAQVSSKPEFSGPLKPLDLLSLRIRNVTRFKEIQVLNTAVLVL